MPDDDVAVTGAFQLTASDVAGLKNLVNGLQAFDDNDAVGIRDLEGTGNNRANPDFGAADQPFIRITNPHLGEFDTATGNRAINPIFAGLDPRAISNMLGAQEAGLPTNAADANIFFMAFGQYIDHGLDFLRKGGNGTIEIGGPGTGSGPSTNNPADLTRGTVTGFDANGIPLAPQQDLALCRPEPGLWLARTGRAVPARRRRQRRRRRAAAAAARPIRRTRTSTCCRRCAS